MADKENESQDLRKRSYLKNRGRADASMVLLHGKDKADEGSEKERIQFPITMYGAVIGAPNVVDPDHLPGYDKAPFNLLITSTETMTLKEVSEYFLKEGLWII